MDESRPQTTFWSWRKIGWISGFLIVATSICVPLAMNVRSTRRWNAFWNTHQAQQAEFDRDPGIRPPIVGTSHPGNAFDSYMQPYSLVPAEDFALASADLNDAVRQLIRGT